MAKTFFLMTEFSPIGGDARSRTTEAGAAGDCGIDRFDARRAERDATGGRRIAFAVGCRIIVDRGGEPGRRRNPTHGPFAASIVRYESYAPRIQII
ncbi:hypothetical protein [Sphingomonas sp.]|uniref:hypothetical protein n=1 Tax=Sphingomonas sp. TaxID=28214 RepID=UPI001EC8AB69|nr:hypothetical protein [Sphingomonas sp.]MBX3594149.1 hypothetical protein [Sphingomonas sp.]